MNLETSLNACAVTQDIARHAWDDPAAGGCLCQEVTPFASLALRIML